MLLHGGRDAEYDQGGAGGDEGLEHAPGLTPSIHIMVVVVSPTTLPEPPGIGGRDDGGQVADVHLAPEHPLRHACRRSAPRRCCRGSSRCTATMTSSTKPPFQSSGRKRGIIVGHPAFLEVAREQGEAHEQEEQVGEDHGTRATCARRGRQAGAVLEAGEARACRA